MLSEKQLEGLSEDRIKTLIVKAAIEKTIGEKVNSFPDYRVKGKKASGQFMSGGKLYDFSVSGRGVSYKRATGKAKRSDGISRAEIVSLDSKVEARGDEGKKCNVGVSCGNTCIESEDRCRLEADKGQLSLLQGALFGRGSAINEANVSSFAERSEASRQAYESLNNPSKLASNLIATGVGLGVFLLADQALRGGNARRNLVRIGKGIGVETGRLGQNILNSETINKTINTRIPPRFRDRARRLQGRAKSAAIDLALSGETGSYKLAGISPTRNSSIWSIGRDLLSVGSAGNNQVTMSSRLIGSTKIGNRTARVHSLAFSTDIPDMFGEFSRNRGDINPKTFSELLGLQKSMLNDHLTRTAQGDLVEVDPSFFRLQRGGDNILNRYGFAIRPNGRAIGIAAGSDGQGNPTRIEPAPASFRDRDIPEPSPQLPAGPTITLNKQGTRRNRAREILEGLNPRARRNRRRR